MPKRVAHMIQVQYVVGDVRTENYWCGKTERWLIEKAERTPEQAAEYQEFVAGQIENPWPVCKKCRAAKDKSKANSGVEDYPANDGGGF